MSDTVAAAGGGIGGIALPGSASAPGADDVTIKTAGQSIGGWERVRITRGIAHMPSDFEVEISEKYPANGGQVVIQPGAPIEVWIGQDKIITGYIDRYAPSISAHGHSVYVTGRGKCQDLVDCAAIWPSNQIVRTSALDIATKLAAVYGITARSSVGPGATVDQLNINLGETSWDIIERVTRYSEMLAYETVDGNLQLARVDATKMASGAAQGVNVEGAEAVWSVDQRFSEYRAVMFSFDRFSDLGAGGNTLSVIRDTTLAPGFGGAARFRPHYVISEQIQNGVNLAEARAKWEKARRYGQSNAVRVTLDSWRDAAGSLWQPNASMSVDLPACKISGVSWLIASVTFSKDVSRGTVAIVSLMPPEAFTPEPIFFNSLAWDVARDLARTNNAANRPPAGPWTQP